MITIRNCEIMQELEHYDLQNLQDIEDRIKTITNIDKYALIIHNKDVREDNTPKPSHFHCVLQFKTPKTIESIAKIMRLEPQYVNKIKTSVNNAYLYLIHYNDHTKYQYKATDVIANFDYLEKLTILSKPKLEYYILKIEQGEIKEYNLEQQVDAITYSKNKTQLKNALEYRRNKNKGVDRNMQTIFIYGESGTGKTSIAKLMAKSKGYQVYISDGGSNPLDNYRGEECIILDDNRDSDYKINDFLKLTDNDTDSYVHCRFYNKSIKECKLLIVTTTMSIYDYYKDACDFTKESQTQLFRRLPFAMQVTKDNIKTYTYNIQTNHYDFNTEEENPVKVIFNPKTQENILNECVNIIRDLNNQNKIELKPEDFPF